jgi:uncharacterized membrane protein
MLLVDLLERQAAAFLHQVDEAEVARAEHDGVAVGNVVVDGLVLVSRNAEGKIEVKDNANDVGRGAVLGAVGGAIIGVIFPPAFLPSAAVGAGIGAGTGAIVDRRQKKEIKADVEEVLPPGSSGIVALFEERWVGEVEKALVKADNVTKHEVDSESAEQVKAGATGDA